MIKAGKSILIALILMSCSTDNFHNTERYFVTERSEYKVGDQFDLTVVISSKERKTIRFYENFQNLKIWTSLRIPCKSNSTGWCNEKMQSARTEELQGVEILNFDISPNNPFKKTFICEMTEEGNHVVFHIPEINYSSKFEKGDFNGISKLGIHGLCFPVNPHITASLEDYIELKELGISLN